MPKKVIKKPRTEEDFNTVLRQDLAKIDSMLRKRGSGKKLAFVLSALRGPDKDSHWLNKEKTTAFVRTNAFPKLAEKGVDGNDELIWIMAGSNVPRESVDLNPIEEGEGFHFTNHIAHAFVQLNIPFTWTNGPRQFQSLIYKAQKHKII